LTEIAQISGGVSENVKLICTTRDTIIAG